MNADSSMQKRKSLVLVLGAGASKEVNLPTGFELKQLIAAHLNILFENGSRQQSGDWTICDSLRALAKEAGEASINPLLHVCWRIRDAMPQAMSIDNFIDSHREQERIATCGKLAITRCILEAEAASSLAIDQNNSYNKLNFNAIDGAWFNGFFQLLTENCQRQDLPSRLQSVTIISFNYDRCFEHYLYHALQNYYGLSQKEAADVMNHLEVHHPYGKVGVLPWMSSTPIGSMAYGGTPSTAKLIELSKSLRTFTQGTDPSTSDIELIREAVDGAERLLFLGFAFHRLNLDLLFSGASKKKPSPAAVFATAYGLSTSDSKQIRDELAAKAGRDIDQIHIRTDLTCAGLFREYWRGLSLV